MQRCLPVLFLSLCLTAVVCQGQEPRGGASTGEKTIQDGEEKVALNFEPPRADVVSVFWVDTEGNEAAYGQIEAGAVMDPIETFPGHFWRLKAAGQVVGT